MAQVPERVYWYRSKVEMYTAQVSEVKTCILYTAQVPERVYWYRSKGKNIVLKFQKKFTDTVQRKKYTAQVSEVKTCILFTAQVPGKSLLIPVKREKYTAQVSEVKTCILHTAQVPERVYWYRSKGKNILLKFQKEFTDTVQKGKVYCSSFRSKNLYTVYDSSSRKSLLIPFKREKYTAQVPERVYWYRSKGKIYCSSSRKNLLIPFKREKYTPQVPERVYGYRSKGKNILLKFQKEFLIPFKKGKIYCSNFRSKHLYAAQAHLYSRVHSVGLCALIVQQGIGLSTPIPARQIKRSTSQKKLMGFHYCHRTPYRPTTSEFSEVEYVPKASHFIALATEVKKRCVLQQGMTQETQWELKKLGGTGRSLLHFPKTPVWGLKHLGELHVKAKVTDQTHKSLKRHDRRRQKKKCQGDTIPISLASSWLMTSDVWFKSSSLCETRISVLDLLPWSGLTGSERCLSRLRCQQREREGEGEGASNHIAAHGFCQVHIQVLFLYSTAASQSRCQRSRMPANSHLVLLLPAQGDSPRVVDILSTKILNAALPSLARSKAKIIRRSTFTLLLSVCGQKQEASCPLHSVSCIPLLRDVSKMEVPCPRTSE